MPWIRREPRRLEPQLEPVRRFRDVHPPVIKVEDGGSLVALVIAEDDVEAGAEGRPLAEGPAH